MRSCHVRHQVSGFTLVEIATVLVVIGILASMAVPAASTYIRRHKAQRALNLLASDLALARMIALGNGGGTAVEFIGGDTYRIAVAGVPRKTVRLGRQFPGVVVDRPGNIVFNARGLVASPVLPDGRGEISVTLGGDVRDVLIITATGLISRGL